jgi:tetratricopeptide (TPR) repeat protein
MSLLAEREFAPARDLFEKAAEQKPGGWLEGYIYSGLGNALMGLGDFEKARTVYEKALASPGEDLRLDLVLLRAAACAQRAGDWDGAEKYLERLIRELPGSSLLYQAKEKIQYGKRRFFTIQVGAYKDEESALKEATRLKSHNLKAFVEQIERKGETLHCVWIGKYDSWQEANLDMQRIRGQTGIENAIVKP